MFILMVLLLCSATARDREQLLAYCQFCLADNSFKLLLLLVGVVVVCELVSFFPLRFFPLVCIVHFHFGRFFCCRFVCVFFSFVHVHFLEYLFQVYVPYYSNNNQKAFARRFFRCFFSFLSWKFSVRSTQTGVFFSILLVASEIALLPIQISNVCGFGKFI